MSQNRAGKPAETQSQTPSRPAFIDAKRRGWLQGAAVAVAAGASGAGAVAQAADPEATVVADEPAGDAGYRLTDHVREYYAKARF